jgi:hypothetical protein
MARSGGGKESIEEKQGLVAIHRRSSRRLEESTPHRGGANVE